MLVLQPQEPVFDRSHDVCPGQCPLLVGAVDLGNSCARIVDLLEVPGVVADEPMTARGGHIDADDLAVLADRSSQGEGRARYIEDRIDAVLERETVDDRGRDTVANVAYRESLIGVNLDVSARGP